MTIHRKARNIYMNTHLRAKGWGQLKLEGHIIIEMKAQERQSRGEIWILFMGKKMYVVWAEVIPMLGWAMK